MKTLRTWIRNLFGFSGREVNGFLILLPLMLVMIMSEPVYRSWIRHRPRDFSEDVRVLDSLVALWNPSQSIDSTEAPRAQEFFTFDPNAATVEEFVRLGFPEVLSNRIANYRQKGGQFRVKSDLLKIYGVDSAFYRQLRPYIALPESIERAPQQNARVNVRALSPTPFDLNEADTTTLKSVFGIGSVLANRIVKFRDRLGGFVREEQVTEVYGLDSATAMRLRDVGFIAEDFVPTKILLNEADERRLALHPYLSRSEARAIVGYRFQHGPFNSVDELRKLQQLDSTKIERIRPYILIDEQP